MVKFLTAFSIFFTASISAENIIAASELNVLGYSSLKRINYLASFCEIPLAVKATNYQSIKSLTPSTKGGNIYYHFTLVEEKYNSANEVSSRLEQLNNPARRTSKHSKLCDLTKSFHVGNSVYFVHTDASIFVDKLDSITLLYKTYVVKNTQ